MSSRIAMRGWLSLRHLIAIPIMRLASSIFIFGIANSLTMVGLPLLVLHRYGLGLGLGLVLGLRVLPNILLGQLVGEVIDKRDSLRISIIAALATAALTVLIPLTMAVWQLEVLSVALGVAGMFAGPARMALRSRVILEGREMDGNGAIVTSERLPAVLGPATAGPIMVLAGLDWLFVVGATTAALACLPLFHLGTITPTPVRKPVEASETSSASWPRRMVRRLFVDNARSLAMVVKLDKMLIGLTITAFTYVFALGISRIFLSQYSLQHFPRVDGALGYLIAGMAAGGVLGSVVVPRIRGIPSGWLYLAGNVLEGFCWLTLPVTHSFPIAIALLVVAGVFESMATVVFFAEVQRRLPNSFSGRYYAMLLPLSDAFNLSGSVVGGLVVLAGLPLSALVLCLAIGAPVAAFTVSFIRPPVPRTGQQGPSDPADAVVMEQAR